MNLHDYDITTMAKEAGIEEARIEATKNLLRMNKLSHEEITQAMDLPLKKVQELAELVAAENKKTTVIA